MGVVAETAILSSSIGFNISGVFDQFWELTIEGLTFGSIYALVAVGYTLVFGVLRLINFAHSGIFMLGLFGQYIALMLLGFSPSGNVYSEGVLLTIVYLGLAMTIGAAVAGGASVALDRAVYRPLREHGAKPLIVLGAAIGMTFVIQEFVHFVLPDFTDLSIAVALGAGLAAGGVFGLARIAPALARRRFAKPLIFVGLAAALSVLIYLVIHFVWPQLGPLGGATAEVPIRLIEPAELFEVGSGAVTNITLIVVISAVVLGVATDALINRSRFGRGLRAVAQDSDTATLMGVSRERVITSTFLISGILAGCAALLYTLQVPSGIIYSGGFLLGLKAFCAAVLGGIGNLRGALLGGLLLGLLENYGQVLLGTEWRDAIVIVLLVLVLVVRPTGVLGERLGKAPV